MTETITIHQGNITLEEALRLVTFKQASNGSWGVYHVHCDVAGSVDGDVAGSVYGHVVGTVYGTISGRAWQFIETPREKLKRLIEEGANKDQLLEAFNQLEDNS